MYTVGVDFGSDSVRTIVVDVANGETCFSSISEYPRWKSGLYQHPEKRIFRQHPLDYLESMEACVAEALQGLDAEQRKSIVGIGIDTTGSTPVPVNKQGVPLSLTREFAENENAMFYLWKDHSAVKEAEELNTLFSENGVADYCRYQGKYSAEWFWAKILHCIRTDERVKESAYTWVEHCDWIVGELCGNTDPAQMYHSSCAAGHKALWSSHWNGLPAKEVLEQADPYLRIVGERFGQAPQPATVAAGRLSDKWAQKLGLSNAVIVSGSAFDAHAGAVGAGICEKTLVSTMGTSAVDMLIDSPEHLKEKSIRDYGGQAENSILPDYIGIETGQAAFGDIFAWFKNVLLWPMHHMPDMEVIEPELLHKAEANLLKNLEAAASKLPEDPFPIALDWFNGRRYPNTDEFQKAAIMGLSLGTNAPVIYRSLIFGALSGIRRIVEGFEQTGMEIDHVIAVGGISKKSAYIMQMMADVLGKEVVTVDSDQTCALGAAIYAAVAGGAYQTASEAIRHMAAKVVCRYLPNEEKRDFYDLQYGRYLELAKYADRQNQKYQG